MDVVVYSKRSFNLEYLIGKLEKELTDVRESTLSSVRIDCDDAQNIIDALYIVKELGEDKRATECFNKTHDRYKIVEEESK